MTTTQADRMAVNAALEKLIAREDADGDAAKIVIAYGAKLRCSSRVQVEIATHTKSSGDAVSGHAPGQGDVTVTDKEKDEYKEWMYGSHKDRVGKYRLWKQVEGILYFHHFWKSSIATQGDEDEMPDQYQLEYDPDTLEPKSFGVQREKSVFSLGFLRIVRTYIEPIYGRVEAKVLGITVRIGA